MTAVFQPMNIARAADLKETSGVPAPQLKFGGDGGDFRHRVYVE